MLLVKKLLSVLLVGVLSISVAGSAFASTDAKSNVNDQPASTTVNLFTDNDVPLGTLTSTVSYQREVENDRVVVTVTNFKDYTLNDEFVNDPNYIDSFKDTSKTYTIEVTDQDEYFVDGQKLSDTELNEQVEPLGPQFSIMANDSGGVPALGHYYSTNNSTSYYFATYSGMTIGGSASGSHISKSNVSRNNSYFSQAANTLDILYGDHQSYLWSKASLSAAVVAFPFTLASVIGAIADGGAIGLLAAQLYSHYSDCNSDLSKAYNLVSSM